MRILFITNMYPVPEHLYYGIFVKEQIEALKNYCNIDYDIFFINGMKNKSSYFSSIFKIQKKIRKNEYDLIHIHYGISGLFLLFLSPSIPIILTLHGSELFKKKSFINYLIQKNITIRVIRKADKVIILNDKMAKILKKFENKIVKIPCGVDIELFKQKQTNYNNNGIFLFGFPGDKERIEKNYFLFDQIIKILQKKYNIEIIEFHKLTRNEVVEKINKLDLLLMTSLSEGSPQMIKETMCCNKPIVSTNVGDVKDLLHGVEGSTVVSSFNPEKFIQPIVDILDLPKNCRISKGKNRIIELGLDSKSISFKLFALYKDLINEKTSSQF